MRSKILPVLIVVFFAQAQLIAQNYEDMSKRELRKVVPQFLKQTDSLKQENIVLHEQVLDFKNKLDKLREDVNVGNKRLNNGITKLKDSIIKINKALSLYKDSIGSIKIARLYTPSGAWIFCNWSDKTPRDSCTFSFSDSTFYKGGLMGTINGKYIDYYLHGYGEIVTWTKTWPCEIIGYKGNWLKSKYDGIGKLSSEKFVDFEHGIQELQTFEGQFKAGNRNGFGEEINNTTSPGPGSGNSSCGNWQNGVLVLPYITTNSIDYGSTLEFATITGWAKVGDASPSFIGSSDKNTAESYYKIGIAIDFLVFSPPFSSPIDDFSQYKDLPVSSDKSENTFSGETIDLDAKAYYTKAISLRPINTEDYIYRALSKQRLKDYTGALNDFTKAIELNPKNLIAYNNRAYTKIILKDLSGACEDWKKFEDLGGIVDEESKNEFCK